MKQTKTRGDLDGFQRITWEQALKEIATKHNAVFKKYGTDGIYSIYACGSYDSRFQAAQNGPMGKGTRNALRYLGVPAVFFASYSTHQNTWVGTGFTGMSGGCNANTVAKYTDQLVLFGSNDLTTRNPNSYSIIRAVEDMKKRNPNAKVTFIGPEFVDTGVTVADKWVVTKPYTDAALIASILYVLIDKTIDSDGNITNDPWLDLDWIDTMVYGFFDSPGYWLNESTGEFDFDTPAPLDGEEREKDVNGVHYRWINPVEPGKSYSAYIMGDDDRLTKIRYDKSSSYTAVQFGARQATRNMDVCSYKSANAGTSYKTKQWYGVKKDPQWASEITGIPVATIEELAALWAKGGKVFATWSGGQQKQADGIPSLLAMQALQIITKNTDVIGTGYANNFDGNVTADPDSSFLNNVGADKDRDVKGYTLYQKPIASCTAWHTAIKMAFGDELKANGYNAQYIPDWGGSNVSKGSVYHDDGGTKAFIVWKRYTKEEAEAAGDPNLEGQVKTYTGSDGKKYKDWEGRIDDAGNGTPVYSGIRLLYNMGGNIIVNQHENSNDSSEMLMKLPKCDYTDADSFCLVSFDNFLSPTPRYSDYVLPGATRWEQQDVIKPAKGGYFYLPQVITPPGESKPNWDLAIEYLKTHEELDSNKKGIADKFAFGDSKTTVESMFKKALKEKFRDTSHPFYGMTWEEYLKNPLLPSKPDDYTISTPSNKAVVDNYIQHMSQNPDRPFVKNQAGYFIKTNDADTGGYNNVTFRTGDDEPYTMTNKGHLFSETVSAPRTPLRYQVYSDMLVWHYENCFNTWHGYLPEAERGQKHRDLDGDAIVYPIPLYYAYEDYFMEAYAGELPPENNRFLLTTTHDRYRSHSSMAENPMLRELSHRVPGKDDKGNFKPANDFNYYATGPDTDFDFGETGVISPLSKTINNDGTVDAQFRDIASYSEIWMNASDGAEKGIADGDLVQVENRIGAVRCVARLSKRCARGFLGLHQGCWYDPRTIDGKTVDVGGNCNTLMASKPSRFDHGNGQQTAMVSIRKINI